MILTLYSNDSLITGLLRNWSITLDPQLADCEYRSYNLCTHIRDISDDKNI